MTHRERRVYDTPQHTTHWEKCIWYTSTHDTPWEKCIWHTSTHDTPREVYMTHLNTWQTMREVYMTPQHMTPWEKCIWRTSTHATPREKCIWQTSTYDTPLHVTHRERSVRVTPHKRHIVWYNSTHMTHHEEYTTHHIPMAHIITHHTPEECENTQPTDSKVQRYLQEMPTYNNNKNNINCYTHKSAMRRVQVDG